MALANCRNHGVTNCRIRAAQCAKAASPVTQPTRSTVRRVQADLARLGYKPGPADGIAGRRTAAAVKRFQSDSGLPADGVISPALVTQLRAKARAAQTKETLAQPRPEKAQAAPKETPAAAPAGEAGDLWGSLAVSQNPDGGFAWAIVWNAGDHAAAKRRAVQVCREKGGENCRDGGWFKNSCGALAVGDGAGWGGGGGDTPEKAAAAATAKCGQYTDNCEVVVSRCSDSAGDAGGVAAVPTGGSEPARSVQRAPGTKFRDCPDCPELVVVPSGSYEMGSPSGEEDRGDWEGPVHRVTIAKPFAVGVYEVTFADWDACVSGGGCNGRRPDDEGWGRGNRPVIYVSWDDAKEYVGWLSRKTGEGYRLLSESEWEYVARAGTRTAYHFGSSISSGQANYGNNLGKTTPVGSYPSNDFGLHDVHGNVWEWVEDCWHEDYRGAPSDGSAWVTGGDCELRVLRGGSWDDVPRGLRSAYRSWNVTGDRDGLVGVRVARTLD